MSQAHEPMTDPHAAPLSEADRERLLARVRSYQLAQEFQKGYIDFLSLNAEEVQLLDSLLSEVSRLSGALREATEQRDKARSDLQRLDDYIAGCLV